MGPPEDLAAADDSAPHPDPHHHEQHVRHATARSESVLGEGAGVTDKVDGQPQTVLEESGQFHLLQLEVRAAMDHTRRLVDKARNRDPQRRRRCTVPVGQLVLRI